MFDAVARRVICAHLQATLTGDPGAVGEEAGVFLQDRNVDEFSRSGPCAAPYMVGVVLPFLQRTSPEERKKALGNLKAYDEKNGPSIAAYSERLAREMCGEEENWALIPPTAPQAAIADGRQRNEDSLRALAGETPTLDREGARVRDEIIHAGSRISVARVGH